MRDVFLNGAAILCGLLFSLGVDPPDRFSFSMSPASRRRTGFVAAAATIVFAAFVHTVHLGTEINDPEAGRFRSLYDGEKLLALSRAREASWKAAPPIQRPSSLSREDQNLNEGFLHAQERNTRWTAGDFTSAWFENRILEQYFAPFLDTPSYISKTGSRWPDPQRVDAEQRYRSAGSPAPSAFESRADAAEGNHFIRVWPKAVFWTVVWSSLASSFSSPRASEAGGRGNGVVTRCVRPHDDGLIVRS